jgi:hypothetical protein
MTDQVIRTAPWPEDRRFYERYHRLGLKAA